LYSPELTVAIDELIAARRQLSSAADNASTKTFVETSQRKLAQFGLTPQQIESLGRLETAPSTVPILAPIDGHLTAKMVYEGAAVKAGDLVLRLANRHQMWIDAQVPESQMSLVSNGQPVRARLVSQPGKNYTGKVLFVHPHLDPQTRTALVRIEIDNQDLALRQGMYATVEILADAYREGLVIPNEAVIDTGRRQLVFVSLGEGHFASKDVTLGLPGQDGTVEITAGLADGEKVVTSGQFLLDSESRLKEAVAKHLSGGLPGHAAHVASAAAKSREELPATQPAVAERIAIPHADDMIREYLAVAEKFGARQEADTPIDAGALFQTANMAAEHASGDAAAIAKRVADAASKLKSQAIAEQRKSFVAVSEAMIDLARRAKLSDNPLLYVMHCPMAFDDKGARWMQREEELANPYYATQMKKCGEVVERIETK
jgi:RND family efflux transporter MFP subunit